MACWNGLPNEPHPSFVQVADDPPAAAVGGCNGIFHYLFGRARQDGVRFDLTNDIPGFDCIHLIGTLVRVIGVGIADGMISTRLGKPGTIIGTCLRYSAYSGWTAIRSRSSN
jgi:hypothetical protein